MRNRSAIAKLLIDWLILGLVALGVVWAVGMGLVGVWKK
jgi:hypothetical protein